MSNPAVFELLKTTIDGQDICIEDNIGEGIHLHIGSIRIDMTISEFLDMGEVLTHSLNEIVGVKNFEVEKYNPYFIGKIGNHLPYLESIKDELVTLGDLKLRYENEKGEEKIIFLKDSPYYIYCNDKTIDLNIYEGKNDIFKDNKIVMDELITEYEENKGFSDSRIVVDDKGYILDGEKRLSILLNYCSEAKKIEVTVMKFVQGEDVKLINMRKRKRW